MTEQGFEPRSFPPSHHYTDSSLSSNGKCSSLPRRFSCTWRVLIILKERSSQVGPEVICLVLPAGSKLWFEHIEVCPQAHRGGWWGEANWIVVRQPLLSTSWQNTILFMRSWVPSRCFFFWCLLGLMVGSHVQALGDGPGAVEEDHLACSPAVG